MAYDSNIANSYLVNGDYDNLTKYLSKFHFTDANKQKKNQNNIIEARSRARVQEGLLSKASSEQAQALKFMNAWDSGNNLPNVNKLYNKSDGSITKENVFSNRASKAIRSFLVIILLEVVLFLLQKLLNVMVFLVGIGLLKINNMK